MNMLEILTKLLNGNRGIAQSFLDNISGYVDKAVNNGELSDISYDELEDFFWDLTSDLDKTDSDVNDMVSVLGKLNHQYTNNRSDCYGYVAKLMKEYYLNKYNNNNTNESKKMKQNIVKLNESQLKKIVAESVKKVLNESSSSIATVEDLCMIVGCSLDNQQEAQLKIEQMLMYLHHMGVIKGFNEDKLDWIFSDEESY